ncbi:MAG: hypothetical protein H0V82_06765 [Candidatus Protochlamydia sp.]|nr:hypothetical protein [Candidatus Protochlamydia sp.]
MFKKKTLYFFVLWLTLGAGTAWVLRKPHSADYISYQKLLEQSDNPLHEETKKTITVQQIRNDVTKQAFFYKDQKRLQWRLKSESSELKFGENEGVIELVEYFTNVYCAFQQQLSLQVSQKKLLGLNIPINKQPIKQALQCFIARQAVFHYKSQKLIAENALMSRYFMPDEKWNDHFQSLPPFMKGAADKIEVLFSKEAPSFKAFGWKATIQEGATF